MRCRSPPNIKRSPGPFSESRGSTRSAGAATRPQHTPPELRRSLRTSKPPEDGTSNHVGLPRHCSDGKRWLCYGEPAGRAERCNSEDEATRTQEQLQITPPPEPPIDLGTEKRQDEYPDLIGYYSWSGYCSSPLCLRNMM